MLSNRPGETFEPVTATRTGWNACRGFRPSPSAAARSAVSIVGGLERLERGERLVGRREHRRAAVEVGRIGLHVAEEEAREAGKLRQPRDLLLHERRRVRDELGVPVVAVLAEPEDEPVRVLLRRRARGGRRRSSSRASRSRTAPGWD